MEGTLIRIWAGALAFTTPLLFGARSGVAQELSPEANETASAEISLQKTIGVREYHGRKVEGNEHEVRPGDTLWRILVKDKGVAENRFTEYVVLIRGLNPALKSTDIIHVGDKIFIPVNPNEALARSGAESGIASATAPGQGKTQPYAVKPGEHVYQIIRTHLGIQDERKVAQYFALVKDLNPQKTNWDVLEKGEVIRLPVTAAADATSVATSAPATSSPDTSAAGSASGPAPLSDKACPEPCGREGQGEISPAPPVQPKPTPAPVIGIDYAQRLNARENFDLIGVVAESLGHDVQRTGDEMVALKDGVIRLDKAQFPVVYNRVLNQRVIIDGDDHIPESLRSNLKQQSVNAPVVSLAKDTTVQDAVGQLLARLGYQPLPAEHPVIIHDGGVSFEAKGQWAVMAPQQSNRPQEIIVINLADRPGLVPDDLKTHLGAKGLHLKNITLPGANPSDTADGGDSVPVKGEAKKLPRELPELIDAMLLAYQIPFGVKESLAAELSSGLNAEIAADRTFEHRGRKHALFMRSIDPAIKAALESKQGIRAIELDVTALKPRDLIAKFLAALGEKVPYKEHRFSAAKGSLQDRFVVKAEGFLLPARSLFLTDREIPARFQPVFFEKGLDIVYFQ
jgi:hypothetical protein